MSIHAFYRACIWLPLVVPAVLTLLSTALDLRHPMGIFGEILLYSLVYGGVPYAVLAVWATVWVGGRSEAEIRRLMFHAPLLMLAVFVPIVLIVGVLVGATGPFAGVALLGGGAIILLGYSYVALTLVARVAWRDGHDRHRDCAPR